MLKKDMKENGPAPDKTFLKDMKSLETSISEATASGFKIGGAVVNAFQTLVDLIGCSVLATLYICGGVHSMRRFKVTLTFCLILMAKCVYMGPGVLEDLYGQLKATGDVFTSLPLISHIIRLMKYTLRLLKTFGGDRVMSALKRAVSSGVVRNAITGIGAAVSKLIRAMPTFKDIEFLGSFVLNMNAVFFVVSQGETLLFLTDYTKSFILVSMFDMFLTIFPSLRHKLLETEFLTMVPAGIATTIYLNKLFRAFKASKEIDMRQLWEIMCPADVQLYRSLMPWIETNNQEPPKAPKAPRKERLDEVIMAFRGRGLNGRADEMLKRRIELYGNE
jgi:hypothetical protein